MNPVVAVVLFDVHDPNYVALGRNIKNPGRDLWTFPQATCDDEMLLRTAWRSLALDFCCTPVGPTSPVRFDYLENDKLIYYFMSRARRDDVALSSTKFSEIRWFHIDELHIMKMSEDAIDMWVRDYRALDVASYLAKKPQRPDIASS